MKPISPKKAISNYCTGCIYDPKAGGTRLEQIEGCAAFSCELYIYRPLTKKTRLALRTPAQIEKAEKCREKLLQNNPFGHVKHKELV